MVVLMDFSFVKMHGAGNDFVLIDDREGTFPVHDYRRVSALATRRSGVGCEGVILVQKSETADFRMRFFNPDGTEADLCGNGARCVAAFAREIGAVRGNVMCFETNAGLVDAEIVDDNQVKVWMPDPKDLREGFVNSGVPHKVVAVESLSHVDVDGEGRRIRLSEEFAPDGTNVDFVVYRKPDRCSIRTYERGVEAETGACGTGSVAAAVIGVAQHGLEFPVHVKTVTGYDLVVDGEVSDDGRFSSVTLTGPVKKVYEGVIDWDSIDIL
jgi:diaminopimelate epimerase